jgi:polar amino acid transport system substrate-binding protein
LLTRLMNRGVLAVSIVAILSATGLLAATTLNDPDRGPVDPAWERVKADGYLLVAVDPSIPPFGEDTPSGPVGFDPAVGAEIARRLGVDVRFVLTGFDGLYDTLLLGYADIVVAALRPDGLRLGRTRYTTQYFDAGHVLISKNEYASLEDLDGLTLAVEFASEGDIVARRNEGISIERFFTADEAIVAVLEDDADAALVDRVSALIYLGDHPHPDLYVAPRTIVADPYVIAVRRFDWRLFRVVQNALLDMESDGTLDRLIAEWFGEG